MTPNLHDLFQTFAEHTEGRLRLSASRRERTRIIIEFFRTYLEAQGFGEPRREYMGIDAVWRDPNFGHIALALEHENSHDMKEFLANEMQHLVDIKAQTKVAIGYPHAGEETWALAEIRKLIQGIINMTSNVFGEQYLVMFGTSTWHEKRRAIQWKGYIIDRSGEIQARLEYVGRQGAARGGAEEPN
ncbi:MAG: hypothetical protein L0191_01745 [Acidobacteria bacterium]|nr:hypothetical protein [Acidobacteriota bacterium]